MARKIVDIGVEGNDGTGDSIREGFRKVNENFREIYAVFGQEGTLSFLDLGDVEGGTLTSYSTKIDHLPIVNSQGSGITFKQLQGAGGLTISYPENPEDPNFGKIVLTQEPAVSELGAPGQTGKFGAIVDGRGFMFGNIGDPTILNVGVWNSALGRTGQTAIPPEKFPVTLGYADNRYINRGTVPGELADAMVGYLAVPAGASGDQVPQANEVVLKTGGAMTGNLFLNDHPGDLAGAGTPLGADDLQAASKYYVDVTAYASKVNIYVSTQGDDAQRKTPTGKEGRAWNYAYKTIVAACLRAEQLIDESPWEPGPYRQFIAYGSGRSLSEIVPGGVAIGGGLNGTTRISFTNDSGNPVDQGVVANRDIIPGKIIVGSKSSARGFIVKYDTNANVDYVDLRDVTGTFEVGENLVFDQPVKRLEISIYVESGTYFEDMPIKLPQNCSLVGDEFRRTVIRPLDRPSQSPWATTWFYRDKTFDGLQVAETNWGYHYLTDPTNKGSEPKNNKDIDVFLCNDATIIRQISCQGHGGFMMVLDPEGQILTKSPYCQQSGCFSASLNKQAFRGGQYVDGQAGSMPVSTVNTNLAQTEITITDAFRVPQTPTSFFVNGDRYKIDTFTDNGLGYRQASELLLANKDFIVEETIAYVNDVVTPTFTYDSDKYSQNMGLIINAVAWDIAFDSNIQSINTALEYYIRNDDTAFETEKFAVIEAITFVKGQLGGLLSSNAVALARANEKMDTILRIVINGIDDRAFLTASNWSYATDPVTGVTTITVVRSLGHNLGTGWSVFIEGASSTTNSPNGSFNVITAVNPTTFTYQVVNAPTGAAGGTLRFRSNPISLRSIPNPPQPNPPPAQNIINGINNSLARLVENRELVKAEYIAFINTYYPDFLFGSTGVVGYLKDIDRIVNAVIYDSIYGGNSQTIIAARGFFDSEGRSLVSPETTQIWQALEWAREVASEVTLDSTQFNGIDPGTNLSFAGLLQTSVGQIRGAAGTQEFAEKVQNNFTLIINAVRFGEDTLPGASNPNISSVITGLQSAKTILEINSNLVRSNTIDYIDSRFLYDKAAAQRDLRQLIDDLAHDIVYTGNLKMIEHGLSYFVGDANFVSDAERDRTLAIIDYFKLLAVNVANNEDVPSIQTISPGSFIPGTSYKIVEVGTTVWTALGAPNNNKNTIFTIPTNPPGITGLVTAGNFVPGRSYTIVSKGTTNFVTHGSTSNTVGTTFIANSVGSGTGTATQGNGKAILSTASIFYRRQFKVPQEIRLDSVGSGIATLLPSLVSVSTSLSNAFKQLQDDRSTIQAAVTNWISNNIATANPGTTWFNFEYNSGDFAREVGFVIDAVSYDMIFNSNVRSINVVRLAISEEFLNAKKTQTVEAFEYLKIYLQSIVSAFSTVASTRVVTSMDLITNIILNGESVIPAFLTPDPSGYLPEYSDARRLVKANRAFLVDEITAWIAFQKANNINPFVSGYIYDEAAFETNVGYILDALEYDLTYGGNLETLVVANSYFDGAVSTIPAGQQEETDAAYKRLKEVVGKVAQAVTVSDKKTVLVQNTTGSGGTELGSVAFARDRVEDIIKKINITAIDSTPTLESLVATTRKMVFDTKGTGFKSASKLLNLNKDFIKAEVVNFINYTYSFDITESTSDQFVTASTANMRVGMPIVFKGTDPFNATVISASPPVEVGGKFQVTFEFARRSPIPDATKQYEIIDNANANYNLVLSLAPTGAVTATSITLVYDSNPGIFGTSTTTTIRVAGGAFGGVSIDNKYYVREIISPTNFTISASISGSTPGAELPLTNDSGEMICMLAYDQATCARDTGFLVSNIATDILYGGRYNTIKAALRYWAGSAQLVVGEQSPETRAGIAYINTLAQRIINNQAPLLNYQELNEMLAAFVISQKFNTEFVNGIAASTDIGNLVTLINTIIQNGTGATPADAIDYPQYKLQLNEETPYDPRPVLEGGSGALPAEIVIQGAGNTSMLSNDWTQLNDLGYGLVATNNGLIETVSVFTYYCWTGYYACNGGQIRSVAGSIAQGEYGLVAEGSDPFEVPDAVNLSDDMMQTARVYKAGPFATQMNVGKTTVFIEAYGHLPYNISEVEINHGYTIVDGLNDDIGFTRYELANITDASATYFSTTTPVFSEKNAVGGKWQVKFTFPLKAYVPDIGKRYVVSGNSNASLNNTTTGLLAVDSSETSITLEYDTDPGTILPSTSSFAIRLKPGSIIRLNLNTGGNNDTSSTGLQKDLEHGQLVTIRSNQNFKFYNVDETNPTRPSTALTFREDPVNDRFAPVYNVLSYNTSDPLNTPLPVNDPETLNDVILAFDKNYRYINLDIEQEYNTLTEAEAGIVGGSPTRTLGSRVGDKYLAIRKIGSASDLKRIITGEMAFAWNGRVHRIKGYILKQISPISGYGIIELSEFRSGTNGSSSSEKYQDLVGNAVPTGITAPTRPGSGYNISSASYNTNTSIITYNISGVETAPEAPVFTGSISGTTLTVTAVASGKIINNTAIQAVSGSGVLPGTLVLQQLTGTGTVIAQPTATGASGQRQLTVSALNDLVVGQIVSGTGISPGTFLVALPETGSIVTLSKDLIAAASGTYQFRQPSLVGTYLINISQTVTPPIQIGSLFTVFGNNNQSYNISGVVLESTPAALTIAVAAADAVATVSANGTMTVLDVTGNTLQLGQSISGTGIPAGAFIRSQISGTTGGAGVYRLSANPSIVTPRFTGSISSTVLTVSAITSGTILVGAEIQRTTGSGITVDTVINGQLTSNVSLGAVTTTATGTDETAILNVNSSIGIISGQLVTGFGIPENTYVLNVLNNVITLTQPLTETAVGGNYEFKTAGGAGTYRINNSQTVTGSNDIAAVFRFIPGTFSASATRIFPSATLYNPALVQDNTITLKAGLSRGEPSDIIVNISSCRVTGHDFSDVGTGGYNTSNYPTKIYGVGREANQQKEVAERGTGRVFWVATDQNGFFRVGRFFTVDQGTGTVSFAASLALSSLDGLGFKRGTSVSEFSTDFEFQDLADDSVPTEQAIDGYINRRLGIDRNDTPVGGELIGTGFLDRKGILEMIGNIKMNNFNVTGLGLTINAPANAAARKDYVDEQQLADSNVDADGKVNNDLLVYNGDRLPSPKWVNAKSSSDNSQIQINLIGDKELDIRVKRETINDSQISKDAGITQDKLEINTAIVQRDQGTLISSITKSVGVSVSTVAAPSGKSPNIIVRFFIPDSPPKPRTGIYYTISGNSNINYNGRYYCETSSARVGGAAAWIELTYAENPGVFGASDTTITPWETTVDTQLAHGLIAGDNVTITGSSLVEVTTTATGAINTNLLTVTTGTGIGTGQLVTGTGIPAKTYVKYINTNTVVLTKKLTTTASGSYTFATGLNGNWTVLAAPTTTSIVISADTRVAGTYTTTAARATKLGLSAFNRNQFNVTNGFVDLETSTTTTVTATVAANNATVTLQNAAAMANITVGSVITIASGGDTVTMPVVNVANPLDVTTNGTQPITVTVTAITSATTFTVSTAFAGTGTSSSAVLNVITGVPLSSVQQIETDRILGNISGSRTAPTTVTTGQIVEAGDGIKNTEFKNAVLGNVETVHGIMSVMTIDTDKPHKNTYGVWNLTKNGASNSVVRTTNDGSIEATSYILDGKLALDTSGGTTIDMYTPGGAKFLTAIGNSGTQPQPNINIGSLTTAVATTATAIATANLIGTITVASTANMYIGQELTFSGTTFGGITNGGTYYIVSIPNATTLTMSASETLSPVFTGAGTGTMTVTSVGVLNGLVSLPRIRANNTVTFNPVNANISIQPRSTNGTVGTVTINPAVNGSINNITIGTEIASPGRFTTVTVTDVTDATNTTTAPFNVAGGAGIAKKLFVGGDLSVSGSTVITGNLTVNGITTTINSSDLTVDDKTIVLASVGEVGPLSGDINTSGVVSNLRDGQGRIPVGLIPGMVLDVTGGTATVGAPGSIKTISQVITSDSVSIALNPPGGFIAGTVVFTAEGENNSTANGGGVVLKALEDKSILWFSATDRWTSNVGFKASEIEDTPIGGDLPSTARFTSVQIDDALTIGSNNNDSITINSKFVTGSQLKTATDNNSTINIAAYDVDGETYTNLVTVTAGSTPKIDIVSTAVGTINNISIGATTRSTGAFTTLAANNTTTLTGAVNINGENVTTTISPTGTGTVTIAPIAEGSIDNMSIGATTAKSASFTSLAANDLVTLTKDTDAAELTRNAQGVINNWSTVTGAVKVTGGMLVQKDLRVGGTIYANGFSGSFTGTADNAKKVQTIDAANATGTYYLTFVNSNNTTAADETVYTDGSLSFDAVNNTLTTTNFSGNLIGDVYAADGTSKILESGANGTGATFSGNATTASSAAKLSASVNIGGVAFDGSASINLPGVDTAGTQDTSGKAATATKLHTTREIKLSGGVTGQANFDGSANIDINCTVGTTSASSVVVTEFGTSEVAQYLLFTDGVGGTAGRQVRGDGGLSFVPFTNTLTAGTFAGKATSAQYADLAENYLADADYDEGTVLIFGGEQEITASTIFNDRRVAGVVSSKPAHLMNSKLEGDHVVAVALQGRVPVKVIGRVQKGDILVTSGKKGYAIVNNDPKVGTVIGKSLENKTTDGDGVIEVVVGKH